MCGYCSPRLPEGVQMPRLVVASTREGAGKTSAIIGMARTLQKPVGYMKPFGDRLLYRKKRLWDYDSALVVNILGLDSEPEEMSIGFDHSKLRFMYDQASTRAKLGQLLAQIEEGKQLVFIEAGKDLGFGGSVHLDALTVAQHAEAQLLLVASGPEDEILDDLQFFKHHIDLRGVPLIGAIANQVKDPDDFENTYRRHIDELGIPLLGVIPFDAELTHPSVGFLAGVLFAKILSGEGQLDRTVKHIFVGAMDADAARREPRFAEEQRLVITSGDRSDMILAALEGDTVGIVLTNNVMPPANIISQVAERGVPMLLVAEDTYQVAKRIDDIEHLLTKEESDKIARLTTMVQEHVNLQKLGA
ncbi:MAG: AAA family ATPase [Candidatus Eisenbacteria bacterium]|nr:AAA family ATPase [Candidatus Eisenbacteria bacterium]